MSTESKTPKMPTAQFANFDPMAAWTQGQQAFAQMMTDAFGRMTSFAEEYAALESQFVTRAQGAVQNWAQLTSDAIAYGAQLASQARKSSLENAKKLTHVA
jgi:hypothetical protein